MTALADQFDSMSAEAATPDGVAFARLSGRSHVAITLAPGYYAHTSEDRLAAKISQLGRLLWVARMKEYYRAKSQALGREVRGEGRASTDKQAARREARDSIVASGRSDDGRVEITSVGLLSWTVAIAPGTVQEVPEEAFLAACGQAGERLIEDHLWRLKLVWAAPY